MQPVGIRPTDLLLQLVLLSMLLLIILYDSLIQSLMYSMCGHICTIATVVFVRQHTAVELVDYQATFTAVDVARARADRQKDLGEQAKRQLACAARARRRWRTIRDGPSAAKVARGGSPPLSLRQFLAGDAAV